MDPPFVGGRDLELPNEVVLNEELGGLFAQVAGRKGSDGRSFPFDLEGDILKGLLVHQVVRLICVLPLRRTDRLRLRSDRIPEQASSWTTFVSLLF